MVKNNNTKTGVCSLSVEELKKQARATLENQSIKLHTPFEIGEIYIQKVRSRGRIIRQVRRMIRDAQGKRHTQIAKLVWPGEK